MKALLLGYHSHHVVGDDYARNDHIALAQDLALLTDAGFRIVPISTLLDAADASPDRDAFGDERLVALTFDDGPVYDVASFVHPNYGPQRGFLNVMREFLARHPHAQPDLCATSFVIASPAARAVMESSFDIEYTFLGPRSMGDDWWPAAIDSGLIDIANHSWDHLHPALPRVAHSEQARADFRQVVTVADADAQILSAQRYIDAKTGGRSAPYFAYPFGHYNTFLVDEYFPSSRASGFRAAITVDPEPVAAGFNRWRLPRYVCGHHWRSPDELATILG